MREVLRQINTVAISKSIVNRVRAIEIDERDVY